WANSGYKAITKDGKNWLNIRDGAPIGISGATRSSDQLWFAWTAGTSCHFPSTEVDFSEAVKRAQCIYFPHPHVQMVSLDRRNDFKVVQQVQIWNDSDTFAFPALATNACTG